MHVILRKKIQRKRTIKRERARERGSVSVKEKECWPKLTEEWNIGKSSEIHNQHMRPGLSVWNLISPRNTMYACVWFVASYWRGKRAIPCPSTLRIRRQANSNRARHPKHERTMALSFQLKKHYCKVNGGQIYIQTASKRASEWDRTETYAPSIYIMLSKQTMCTR